MVTQKIALPSREECAALWEQYATPAHIRAHMEQVARVARLVSEQLVSVGISVHSDVCERAALLHDLVRVTEWDTLSFELFDRAPSLEDIAVWEQQRTQWPTSIPHAEVNYRILKDRYPEIAHIIRLHSLGSVFTLVTWEEKVVYYADRRVAHDTVVSVQERLDEGFTRYRKTQGTPIEQDTSIVEAVFSLEHEIFDHLPIEPEQLL